MAYIEIKPGVKLQSILIEATGEPSGNVYVYRNGTRVSAANTWLPINKRITGITSDYPAFNFSLGGGYNSGEVVDLLELKNSTVKITLPGLVDMQSSSTNVSYLYFNDAGNNWAQAFVKIIGIIGAVIKTPTRNYAGLFICSNYSYGSDSSTTFGERLLEIDGVLGGAVGEADNTSWQAFQVEDTSGSHRIYALYSFLLLDPELYTEDDIDDTPPSVDPYIPPDGPDEPSEPGGGEGDRDDVDVPVPIPGLPPISAADTGFVTLFNPNATQIRNLANYMWSNNFDISLFKNIVANPIECILGLSIIPFTPRHGEPDTVKVGNIDTLMQFPTVASQFEEIDCGSIQVSEYWGSYLDYSPYTKISLYLPYIGIVPLDIDEVQGKTLAIKYHVDVLSGACIAYLLCGTSVLYSYIGQCSCNVPITSNDFTNTVNGVLGIAGNIGSLVALGGSSAPTAAGSAIKTAASMASNAINMLKPNIQKSGAMAGTGGLMGTQYPYIIKQRPNQSVPAGQNTFKGYPSNIAVKLGNLSGYTEVDEVHLDGIPATDAEMNEILQLLSEGVYI